MGRVRFVKADPKLPADKGGRRWLHRIGGKKLRGDGSYELVGPIYFLPGQTYDVTDAEEEWLVRKLPSLFEAAPKRAKKADKAPEPESPGED